MVTRKKAVKKVRHAWELLASKATQKCRKCGISIKYLRGGPKGGAVLTVRSRPTRGFIQMQKVPACRKEKS